MFLAFSSFYKAISKIDVLKKNGFLETYFLRGEDTDSCQSRHSFSAYKIVLRFESLKSGEHVKNTKDTHSRKIHWYNYDLKVEKIEVPGFSMR